MGRSKKHLDANKNILKFEMTKNVKSPVFPLSERQITEYLHDLYSTGWSSMYIPLGCYTIN